MKDAYASEPRKNSARKPIRPEIGGKKAASSDVEIMVSKGEEEYN
jgi:hypothetical protein